uniref:Magi-1 n=1 Tax=Pristionchus pacificus TaxID=54126 RepID=A0A8R1UIS0_PRIPA
MENRKEDEDEIESLVSEESVISTEQRKEEKLKADLQMSPSSPSPLPSEKRVGEKEKGGKEEEELDELTKLQLALDQLISSTHTATTASAMMAGGGGGERGGGRERDREAERRREEDIAHPRRRLIRVPCRLQAAASTSATAGALRQEQHSQILPFTVRGGAAHASLILVDIVRDEQLAGVMMPGEIVLTIEGVPVSGMTVSEVTRLLERTIECREMMAVEVCGAGSLPDDLCEILSDKRYADLQTVIRDNVYTKTVPYTTRPARMGEVDGEHYRFVDMATFEGLLAQGKLLEHGSYEGHLYGTPRPLEEDVAEMVQGGTRLGPLPPNWEVAYADNGEKYFIDHNSGTTQWNDPRELPQGWEQVDDPVYGTFYVDHVHKLTTYDRPMSNGVTTATANGVKGGGGPTGGYIESSHKRPLFTRNVDELRGELISCRIVKGPKGLGFTLIGNDASSRGDEFIQVKSILPHGAAAADGVLQPGDVLVSVNGNDLLGASQTDACHIFVDCPVGDPVDIIICRGYPLMLDPSNRIITENVYMSNGTTNGGVTRGGELVKIDIHKGNDGFGFTIAESVNGQRVKNILYKEQCPNLCEGDVIVELDGRDVRSIGHKQLVDLLRDCPQGYRGRLIVRRSSPKQSRSRTPTAAFRYGEARATPAPSIAPRSKTPAPNSRNNSEGMYGTVNGGANGGSMYQRQSSTLNRRRPNGDLPPAAAAAAAGGSTRMRPSSTTLGFATTPTYMPLSAFQRSDLITVNLIRKPQGFGFRLLGGLETDTPLTVGQIVSGGAAADDGRLKEGDEIVEIDGRRVEGATHTEAVSLLEQAAHVKHVKLVIRRRSDEMSNGRKMSGADQTSPSAYLSRSLNLGMGGGTNMGRPAVLGINERDLILHRGEGEGFGFIIMSSANRDGAYIGQIIAGSPAAHCPQLQVGDRVVAVNGAEIADMTHGEIVGLIKASGTSVRLTIADPAEPASNYVQHATTAAAAGTPMMAHSDYQSYSNNNGSLKTPNGHGGSNGFVGGGATPVSHHGTSAYDSMDGRASIVTVELSRGTKGFGFSIRGGTEFDNMPLFVLRIAEDGPAASREGRLRVGDQLMTINGRDTKGLTHEEAITLIKMYPTVRLTVRRVAIP